MSLFPKKIVGLDFHDYYAQVVELKGYGKKVSLSAFNRVAIPPHIIKDGEILNKDDLKKILSSFFETANPQPIKAKSVVCSFPSKKVFTHVFKFPVALSEKEIKKALPFEAETVIPYSIQDIYWDFRVLSKEDASKKHASQHVLFAGVPRGVADSYVELLNSLGLVPFAFTIPSECAEYALSKQLPKDKSALVIDVGSLVTTYSIIKNRGLVKTCMSLEGGRSLIMNLAKTYQVTEAEIIDQKEKNSLDKVFLPVVDSFIRRVLGGGQEFLNLPEVYETTQKFFPNQKISFGDPRIGIDIDSDKFLPLDKKEGFIPYSIYFTQAFGLAIKGLNPKKSDGLNLLPDKLRESFASKKLSFIMGLAAALLAVASLTFAVLIVLKHQELSYQRLAVENERQSLQQLIFGTRYGEIKTAMSDFNTEVRALVSVQNSLFSVPALLDDISSNIPKGVSISSLNFDDADLSVEISGVAKNRDVLLETQKNFEDAEYVEEVIAPRSNFDDKYDISFFIKLKLKFNELKLYASRD